MADSTKVNQDPAGNIKRGKPERGKSGKRIDGVAALIMAIDRAPRNENHASAWSGPDSY
jgi:hypothetical protein